MNIAISNNHLIIVLYVVNYFQRMKLDVVTYTIIITALGSHGFLDRMEDLREEMKKLGIKPNRITYNAMLSSYAKYGKLEEIFRILEEMEEIDMEMDSNTYTHVLEALDNNANPKDMIKLLQRIKKPNVYAFTSLIDSLGKQVITSFPLSQLNSRFYGNKFLANRSRFNLSLIL
jgi:pentatricopeptide repeat protein